MAGSRPGTERWILWLRDRGYDLRAELQAIRAGSTASDRRTLLATLAQRVVTDQLPIAQLVVSNGGAVRQQYWVVSGLSVEIPPGAVPILRAHPRVRRMVADRARYDSSFSPVDGVDTPVGALAMPQSVAIDVNNHNVARARAIILAAGGSIPPGAERGNGVRVAVFDTGIDEDGGGVLGPPGPHDAFVDQAGQSRLDAVLRAGPAAPVPDATPPLGAGIDCNNIWFSGGINNMDIAYRPCLHSISAFHGTAMAGIIAGRTHVAGSFHDDGHAPDARLVSVSISEVPPGGPVLRWTISDATMLTAVQMLRAWTSEYGLPVHIANISFDGWSDPSDPICVAIDEMAVAEDMLIVSSAGNASDDTRLSYGYYNGLSVGAIYARADSSDPYMATGFTARGPLASDARRFFPDVCATGAGEGMASPTPTDPRFRLSGNPAGTARPSYLELVRLDSRDASARQAGNCAPQTSVATNVHLGMGTSEAAAQVAGAASLYRAARPQDSAQMTRAAILLSVVRPPQPPGAQGPIIDQDTYHGRNTYGVGYVRDDFLAELAVRDPSVQPAVTQVVLDGQGASATTPLSAFTVTAGARYAVACCWPRQPGVEDDLSPQYIDLEVRSVASPGTVIARSQTRGSTYQRLGFVAPSAAALEVRVSLAAGSGTPVSLPVAIAARRFDPDLDPSDPVVQFTPMLATTGVVVESRPAQASGPSSCVATCKSQSMLQVVPNPYGATWGSGPLGLPMLAGGDLNMDPAFNGDPPSFRGFNLIQGPINSGPASLHFEISPVAMSGTFPLTIQGLAFRSWRPFNRTGSATVTAIWMGTSNSITPVTDSSLQLSYLNGTQVLTNAYAWPSGPASAGGVLDTVSPAFDEFGLQVPFGTPYDYSGNGNLHIWMKIQGQSFQTEYEVDYAGDFGTPSYGLQRGISGGTFFPSVGQCPIIALLGPVTDATLAPSLVALGTPEIGRALELHGTRVPALAIVTLGIGDWIPNLGTFGSCLVHVNPTVAQVNATSDAAGMVRWEASIPNSTTLLSALFGFQALVTSNGTLTNGLAIAIGGGL